MRKWVEWAKFGARDALNQADPNLLEQLTPRQRSAFIRLLNAWGAFENALAEIACAGCGLTRNDLEEPDTGDICGCAFMLDEDD